MIDLRSDTLTLPSKDMMAFAFAAPVGDAGRQNESGRSCDPMGTTTMSVMGDLSASIVIDRWEKKAAQKAVKE